MAKEENAEIAEMKSQLSTAIVMLTSWQRSMKAWNDEIWERQPSSEWAELEEVSNGVAEASKWNQW